MGVLVGAVLAITSIWSIPYHPVWSIVCIAIAILVLYGLVSHRQREAIQRQVVGMSSFG